MAIHKGKTTDAQSPIMGAKEWTKGKKIEGTIARSFETQNGTLYEVLLKTPITLKNLSFPGPQKKVSLGNMAGIQMALQSCGLESFQVGDRIIMECTGATATNKGNDRIDFVITVDRPEQ